MSKKFKIVIEETAHLAADEATVVRCLATSPSMEDFNGMLKVTFKDWFVYQGGNHIALHRSADYDKRVLIATEV